MEKRALPPGFRSPKAQAPELPTLSAYRELRPASLDLPTSAKARFFERRRVIIGLAIAAAFHLTLGLAWWLTPPLRLKAGYAPDRWMQVLSVPPHDVPLSLAPVPPPAVLPTPGASSATPPSGKAHSKAPTHPPPAPGTDSHP